MFSSGRARQLPLVSAPGRAGSSSTSASITHLFRHTRIPFRAGLLCSRIAHSTGIGHWSADHRPAACRLSAAPPGRFAASFRFATSGFPASIRPSASQFRRVVFDSD